MINCPSCGAALPVRGLSAPYTTCSHCQSLILRQGQSVEEVGKVAAVPDDVSPVQIGTRFHVDGIDFVVAGRVRWGWSGGSWNEWLLASDAGDVRWLGEAMGMYMLTAERADVMTSPLARSFADGTEPVPGQTVLVDGVEFAVTDVKQAECLGGEGDLPFPPRAGWAVTNVDFRALGGQALSLQRDAQGTTAWLGSWHELADLSPRALSEIEGWTVPEQMR
ncbi:DUF4178 domain-containing protein [Novosphingobium sp. BL-8H]|uniref:DUF4178 domain-containing protein n=1 Tax=Novosphingobium sp. BL-8H TaxID=3127640 RepID=UPI003757A9F2